MSTEVRRHAMKKKGKKKARGESQEFDPTSDKDPFESMDAAARAEAKDLEEAGITKRNLMAFRTDDNKIKRFSVASKKDLPLNKYSSLGAIFNNETMKSAFKEHPIPVYKSSTKDVLYRHYSLGPLPPGKPEVTEVARSPRSSTTQQAVGPLAFNEVEYMPDVKGEELLDSTRGMIPPKPHEGVVWPKAWAPAPPYTAPGYSRAGIRQSVGVVQVDRVPTTPSRGITDTGEYDLPTWVSPLYKSYGIGGPYGVHGPFYEPPNINNVVVPDDKFAIIRPSESGPPPKKCALMRLFDGLRKNQANTDSKQAQTGSFLASLDANLTAIKSVLRNRQDTKDIMSTVVNRLTLILEDAKKYANTLDPDQKKKIVIQPQIQQQLQQQQQLLQMQQQHQQLLLQQQQQQLLQQQQQQQQVHETTTSQAVNGGNGESIGEVPGNNAD